MTLTWIIQAENLLLPATGWGRKWNTHRSVALAVPLPYFKTSWALTKHQVWPPEALGDILFRFPSGHPEPPCLPQTPGPSTLHLARAPCSLHLTPILLSILGIPPPLWSLLNPLERVHSLWAPNPHCAWLSLNCLPCEPTVIVVTVSLFASVQFRDRTSSLHLCTPEAPSTQSVPNKCTQQTNVLLAGQLSALLFRWTTAIPIAFCLSCVGSRWGKSAPEEVPATLSI